NGMKISLLEKISGLGVVTPEKLLEIVQLYEVDQQLIDSRTLQATSDSTTLALQSSSIYPVSSIQHPSFTSLSPSYPSSSSQYYSHSRYPTSNYSSASPVRKPYAPNTRNRSNLCYRCGQPGHYARGCLNK
ncbi:unnamed protein product, partial [Didymodactylos carnosus]